MAGQHQRWNEHELGQTLGDGEGQGGLGCCSPWGCRELGTIEQLNNNNTESKPYTSMLASLYALVWGKDGQNMSRQANKNNSNT